MRRTISKDRQEVKGFNGLFGTDHKLTWNNRPA
jgi:hypothetical protein